VQNKKIFIVGAGEFAQIAYEYFTHDSEFEVVAFCVNKEYIEVQRYAIYLWLLLMRSKLVFPQANIWRS